MIQLSEIRLNYNSHKIFNNLNFELKKGERVGLLGANGSGKTTLCHVIMGLVPPDSGSIEIFGKKRRVDADFTDVRGRIGYLFQDADDQLFCPTVLDDVAFGPLNMGKTVEEAKSIALSTLKKLNLEGFEDRITYQLSGGEKRLVSLATVLAMDPEVLILDEPTTGLDEDATERIVEILNNSDLTYLIISHDRDFISRTSNIIKRLRRGVISEYNGEFSKAC
jgi:cobalt/nickel transport system ATP-binding protein